jgi:two-component system OmpR family sensor kinase
VNAPATLGRGLGRSLAFATLIGIVMFAVVDAIAIYITEDGEECSPGVLEDPPLEIVEQCAIALAFATPFGVGMSLLIARKLTHTTTDRLDEVISSASRMTGEQLDERLPVSEASDALDRLSTALNGLLERIETGVAAQRQFAADASHELRTPLTVISTNLEVARRKARESSHWENVADGTLAEVRRMGALIDKLLELSRAGAAGLHHERRELRLLVGDVVDRAHTIGDPHRIRVELAAGAPVEAEVDPEAIAIVVDNLVRNAIDHSPADHAVTVSCLAGAAGPQIVVEDDGPGVPVEMRERIFEPFARGVHRATDRNIGPGFGLGLAICHRIVAGHGGSITVVNRETGGARFTVVLPPPAKA